MHRFKKIVLLFLLFSLSINIFACKKSEDNKKIKIISSVFASYDFAKQIAYDKADVSMLIKPGASAHSYEPTPKDIIDIQNADLFIYVGGESEKWVDDILATTKNKNVLKLMDTVDLLNEEEDEYDEHVWTSTLNAQKICESICEKLKEIDSVNGSVYQRNCDDYLTQLKKLTSDFERMFETKKNKTLIFGDRFPFRYFANEFSLDCYSAFPGCSEQTEPDAKIVAFLIDKIKNENIKAVFYIEFSNQNVAKSLADTTGVKTSLLHSCHNVSSEQIKNGESYISLMEQNLKTLQEIL